MQVTRAKAWPMAVIKSVAVRASALRRRLLILLHIISDWVEVWRVGGQEQHLGSGLEDERQGLIALMRREIVHDHNVSSPQGGSKHLTNISTEGFRISRPFQGHARRRAIQANGRDHGDGLPMAGGTMAMSALPSWRSPAQACQIGLGSGFIQKNQTRRIEALLPPLPGFARADQIGALLFAGAECLFLYVSPIFASTT